AKNLAKKLWEFFVYPNPEAAVVERIAKVFVLGDIRATMRAIARSPEFLSDKAVRKMVKSPVDLCIPIARQMGAGKEMAEIRKPTATPFDRIEKKTLDVAGALSWIMQQQGLSLLYPPDVGGWKWNEAWATPDAMAHRFLYRGVLLWGEKGPDTGAKTIHGYLSSRQPKDGAAIAEAFLRLFDVPLDEERKAIVAKLWNDNGGVKALEKLETVVWLTDRTLGLMMASPESQLF
ncbi:MAG TPA: DUF1800 family protein, partial [Fimbriimonas sp.]